MWRMFRSNSKNSDAGQPLLLEPVSAEPSFARQASATVQQPWPQLDYAGASFFGAHETALPGDAATCNAAADAATADTTAAASSPFAQLSHEYVPPEAAGYQPLLEPLLPDLGLPLAASSPVEDWTTSLRVTATNIGSSRFRRTVSVNQMEPGPSGQQQLDHPSVLSGASGPGLIPRTGDHNGSGTHTPPSPRSAHSSRSLRGQSPSRPAQLPPSFLACQVPRAFREPGGSPTSSCSSAHLAAMPAALQARQQIIPDVATVMANYPQRVHSPIHYSPGTFKVPLPSAPMPQQYPYHHPVAPGDRLHDALAMWRAALKWVVLWLALSVLTLLNSLALVMVLDKDVFAVICAAMFCWSGLLGMLGGVRTLLSHCMAHRLDAVKAIRSYHLKAVELMGFTTTALSGLAFCTHFVSERIVTHDAHVPACSPQDLRCIEFFQMIVVMMVATTVLYGCHSAVAAIVTYKAHHARQLAKQLGVL